MLFWFSLIREVEMSVTPFERTQSIVDELLKEEVSKSLRFVRSITEIELTGEQKVAQVFTQRLLDKIQVRVESKPGLKNELDKFGSVEGIYGTTLYIQVQRAYRKIRPVPEKQNWLDCPIL